MMKVPRGRSRRDRGLLPGREGFTVSQLTLASDNASPFDSLRRVDADGEFWSARDLMSPLGYERWENFAEAIERAKIAACNSGHDCDAMFILVKNFRDATKVVRGPAGADYRLTRFAAYLLAMNGDPRKDEVAAAQSYFAIKTREAELAASPVMLRNPVLQGIVDMSIQLQATLDEQARLATVQSEQGQQLAELVNEVSVVRDLIPHMSSGDGHSVKDLARAFGLKFAEMHQWLRDNGVTFYDRPVTKQGIKPYAAWEAKGWAFGRLDPLPNGGAVWATYFTDDGFVEVKRRLRSQGLVQD